MDDTLILCDEISAKSEVSEFKKVKIPVKPPESLSYFKPLAFNGCVLYISKSKEIK